jgi:RES domain-containing protein
MATYLWRVVNKRFQDRAFDGGGAKLFPGRWNPHGLAVIYAATSKSQALLEVLSHLGPSARLHDFVALPIVVPNSVTCKRIELSDLPDDWRAAIPPPSTTAFGETWLSQGEFPVLLVPSHQVYGEHIALINPSHSDFTKIIPGPVESILWDDQPFLPSQTMNLESHKDVFLCHASEDKATIVEPLYRALFGAGISCWYDNTEIKWGDSIAAKVNEGLSKSDYVLAVLTENFMKKNFPKSELFVALNKSSSSGKAVVLPLISGSEEFRKQLFSDLALLSDKLHVVWKNNPDEIAGFVRNLLRAA